MKKKLQPIVFIAKRKTIALLFVFFLVGESTVGASLSSPSSIPIHHLQGKLKRIKIYGCTGVCAAGVAALAQISPLANQLPKGGGHGNLNRGTGTRTCQQGGPKTAPHAVDLGILLNGSLNLGSILLDNLDWRTARWKPWVHDWIRHYPMLGSSGLCWWMMATATTATTITATATPYELAYEPTLLAIALGSVTAICMFMIQCELITAMFDTMLNAFIHRIPWSHMMNSVPKRQGGGFVIV